MEIIRRIPEKLCATANFSEKNNLKFKFSQKITATKKHDGHKNYRIQNTWWCTKFAEEIGSVSGDVFHSVESENSIALREKRSRPNRHMLNSVLLLFRKIVEKNANVVSESSTQSLGHGIGDREILEFEEFFRINPIFSSLVRRSTKYNWRHGREDIKKLRNSASCCVFVLRARFAEFWLWRKKLYVALEFWRLLQLRNYPCMSGNEAGGYGFCLWGFQSIQVEQ